MALTTNIFHHRIIRGDTFIHRITVENTDETAKDITGATAKYTIRSPTYEGVQVLQKTTGGGGIQLTTPSSGILDVTLTNTETEALVPGQRYVYDCELTIAGQVCTVQMGRLTIEGDVTHT